ncbi:MAG: ECF-type riboflavin transporter substrate-binding protein [Erysipelotrichaceae bacterium]|nr:ECF-type riboflavin transporter substrate-binding protein [Erysipelotrichaceae bacterium]
MTLRKESVGKMIVGKWDTKTVVGVAIGAALYGVLMNYGGIRVFTNTSLTTAMIIDVIVGALFGPLPAALMAFCGNVIADLIGGWGFWFDWSVGNGVLAFFVGLLPLYGARINDGVFTTKHAVIYAITVIVGNLVAFGAVTPLLTYLWYSNELTITWSQCLSAFASNASVQIIVGIPLLFLLAGRNARSTNLSKED